MSMHPPGEFLDCRCNTLADVFLKEMRCVVVEDQRVSGKQLGEATRFRLPEREISTAPNNQGPPI